MIKYSFKKSIAIVIMILLAFFNDGVITLATSIDVATISDVNQEFADENDTQETAVEDVIQEDEVEGTMSQTHIEEISNQNIEVLLNESEDEREDEWAEEIATASEVLKEAPLEEDIFENEFIVDDYIAPITKKKEKTLFGSSLQDSYDSRNIFNPNDESMSIIPPVRNQGTYKTGWAFAMTSLFEIAIRKNGFVTSEGDSNLSEAAMAYFVNDLKNVTSDSNFIDKPGFEGNDYNKITNGNFSTVGGNSIRTALSLSSHLRVSKEDDNSRYEDISEIIDRTNNGLDGIPSDYAFKKDGYVLSNAMFINRSDISAIKKAIVDYGGVAFAYKGGDSTSTFVHEDGGEYYYYTGLENDFENGVNYANHSIIMIGWDDNIEKEKFYTGGVSYDTASRRASHKGAWLCRNSLGDSEFNGGYFWLSYDEGSIDSTLCAIEVIKSDNYEYNYHYDTTNAPVIIEGFGNIRYANMFKVSSDSDQVIDAVSVAIGSANSVFDIEIYTKDEEMDNPADGVRVLLKRDVTKTFAGIYTIDLDDSEKVALKKGSYYSIILRARESTGDFSLWADDYNVGSVLTNYNEATVKQSFIGHNDGWNDINIYSADFDTNDLITIDNKTYGMNWRIKALTNEATIISFDRNGADNFMPSQLVEPGVATHIDNCTLIKTGYTFDGWKDQNDSEWTNASEINIDESKTLIAKWKPITYVIKYEANDGNVSTTSVVKTYGTKLEKLETPLRDGYQFDGWYTKFDTATKAYSDKYDGSSDLSTTQDEEKIIYAKWTLITNKVDNNANKKNATRINNYVAQTGNSTGSTGGTGVSIGKSLQNAGVPSSIKTTKIDAVAAFAPIIDATSEHKWTKDSSGKWHLNNLADIKNSWVCVNNVVTDATGNATIVSDFYFFDNDGAMLTGWLIDASGKRYFLEDDNTSEMGKAVKGWNKIDNAYYYFDAFGILLTDGTTPDGYKVDTTGKWIDTVGG